MTKLTSRISKTYKKEMLRLAKQRLKEEENQRERSYIFKAELTRKLGW